MSKDDLVKRLDTWKEYERQQRNEFWDTLFRPTQKTQDDLEHPIWPFPEENLLYFIQKNAPHMEQWKKELIRIVRLQAQYFYPQIQTKLMNEGWATFWHYTLMQDLYDEGYIDEGSYLEFINWHCRVVPQVGLDGLEKERARIAIGVHGIHRLPPINVYALGFNIFKDLRRACENPTEEDYKYLPLVAGQPWLETLHFIMENFKDENFILEFLGPNVIRDMKLACVEDTSTEDNYTIISIQSDDDVYKLRKVIAEYFNFNARQPQIEITGFDKTKDRTLYVKYTRSRERVLEKDMEEATTKYLHKLWGYPLEFRAETEDGTLLAKSLRKY